MYVVADDHSETFAKMAAARHSSNSTAEAMQYIHASPNAAVSIDNMLAEAAPDIKNSFRQSKLAGEHAQNHLVLQNGVSMSAVVPVRLVGTGSRLG